MKNNTKNNRDNSSNDDSNTTDVNSCTESVVNTDSDTEIIDNIEPSEEELHRAVRIAKKILTAMTKSMGSIAPKLNLKGNDIKVSNKVNLPLVEEYSGVLSISYIILKGDRTRTVYFCFYNTLVYKVLKDILVKQIELRNSLIEHTDKIQIACPELNEGLYFKSKSGSLFRKKKVSIFQFQISKNDD